MEPRPAAGSAADFGVLDLAATLLIVQAGLGLVAAVGVGFLTVATGGAPLYLLAAAVALGGPLLAIVVARGLTRGRRWARNGALTYEALVLIGAVARLFFLRELAFGLVVTLTGIVLPLTVGGLVLSSAARRVIAGRCRLVGEPARGAV
jgi:hypothetical protein